MINYLLALGVLTGLYVLLDLIINLEDFSRGAMAASQVAAPSTWEVVRDMVDYYSYQMLVIFQQVAGVIPTLAAGFTMVRMTRHHELTAMLASGVSLYRVAAPIILASMVLSALTVLNQEFVISRPEIIEKLLRRHDEVKQSSAKAEPLSFLRDRDNSLLSAGEYNPVTKTMRNIFIVDRDASGKPTGHTVAERAEWKIPEGKATETWIYYNVNSEDDTQRASPDQRIAIPNVDVMYRENSTLTPEQIELFLSKKAVDYLSSRDVHKLAQFSPEMNQPLLYKIMHLRFTQPLMNIVMLLIGIPFLLTREPNRLVVNMLYCTAVSAVVFIATFVIFQMGGKRLDPLFAAWLPVLIFGPAAVVLMDFIKT